MSLCCHKIQCELRFFLTKSLLVLSLVPSGEYERVPFEWTPLQANAREPRDGFVHAQSVDGRKSPEGRGTTTTREERNQNVCSSHKSKSTFCSVCLPPSSLEDGNNALEALILRITRIYPGKTPDRALYVFDKITCHMRLIRGILINQHILRVLATMHRWQVTVRWSEKRACLPSQQVHPSPDTRLILPVPRTTKTTIPARSSLAFSPKSMKQPKKILLPLLLAPQRTESTRLRNVYRGLSP
jgi:hypothetical protein